MQIKTTIRYHFTPVRMAIINKSTNNTCWWRLWRKGNSHALLVRMQTGAATVERVCSFLKKLNMELPYDSAIPLLGIYLKKPKTLIWKTISTPKFIAALFTITKTWKQPKCPSVDEWIKQLVRHSHNEMLLSHKKEKNFYSFFRSVFRKESTDYTTGIWKSL